MSRNRFSSNARRAYRLGLSALLLSVIQLLPLSVLAQRGLAQSASAPPPARTVPSLVREGFSLLDQNLVDQSIPLFQSAVRQYPQSVEARLGLAIAYRRSGQNDQALQAYQSVLALDPNNRLALLSLGILGSYNQRWQNQGIKALDTLLTVSPNDLEARAQRALLYGYQGRFDESIADYEVVLQQGNPSPDVLLGAAQVYSYSGDFLTSLDLFDRYRQTGGTIDGDAATAYARSLRETGDPQRAVQVLEPQLARLPELNGVAIRMRAELALAYGALSRFNQAEKTLSPLRPRLDSRMILARSLIGLGGYSGNSSYISEGVNLFEKVLTQTPNALKEFVTVSVGQEIADRLSAYPGTKAYALEIYRQLLAKQPNDRGLQIQEAILEREVGAISTADLQQRLESALQTLPNDPAQQKLLAQTLTRLDSPDPELLPLYQSLLPTNVPLLYFRIAQIQVQQGDLVAARQTLATYAATDEGKQSPETSELLLAEIDRRAGDLEASAQRYEGILARSTAAPGTVDPGISNSALQGLAGIRQSQGRLPEAVAIYDRLIQLNPEDDAKPLGRASLAYQAELISQAEAEAVLNNWVAAHDLTTIPPELVSLVAALPSDPSRTELYTALLKEYPTNTPLQLRYVELLASRSPSEAEAYLRNLIASNPANVDAYFVQANVALQQGNLRLASKAYQAILAQQPNNTDALSALGGIRFRQHRYTAASQLYSNVLTLQPDNAIAQTALIDLTVVQGRRLEALRRLEELQLQQAGEPNPELQRQQQLVEEGFLQQRGFQLPWERY